MTLKNFEELKPEIEVQEKLRGDMKDKGLVKKHRVELKLIFEGDNFARVMEIANKYRYLKIKEEDNDPTDEHNYVNIHKVTS
jgi:hypothetical protein